MWSLAPVARSAAKGAVVVFATDQAGRRLSDCLESLRAGACMHSVAEGEAHAAVLARGCLWKEGAALEQLAALLATEKSWHSGGQLGGESGLRSAVREKIGFSLCCTTSKVVGAGDGIFASGTIPRGRVLSVYAGTHLGPWDAFLARGCQRLLPWKCDDGYVLRQADGSTVDGLAQAASVQRKVCGYVRPSASSQLANHPPPGTRPNAGFMNVYVPPSAAFASIAVYPVWGRFSGPPRVVTLLVSLEQIADGEEVLVDYRLGGIGTSLPSWYACVA